MPDRIARYKGGEYPVRIGKGLLDRIGETAAGLVAGRTAFVATDETVGALYLDRATVSLERAGFRTASFSVPAGEASKSPERLLELYGSFHAAGLTRSDLVVALGGGVVGDLAGYAAATWMRGVPVMQVPTTLLAQVDSSIGGKTGIDLPFGKNLVGAFHQPAAVVLDPSVLGTLPRARMAEGMAEVVKYGCIADEDLFVAIESGFLDLDWVVERCVRIKTGVVSRDEKDTGERMMLNFGHTVGHAVEKASAFALSHGESVSIGMAAATRIGERLGVTPHGTAERLESVLVHQGLPIRSTLPLDTVVEAMASDKKRLSGKVHFVFLERIGEAALHPMPVSELAALLKEVAVVG